MTNRKYFFHLWHRFLKDYGKYFKLFSYSTASSILQQFPIPFVVLPFLSSKLSQNEFGEFVIVLSIVNFFSAIFGSSVVMSIYRQHKDISLEEKPFYLGSVVKQSLFVILTIGIILIALKEPLFKRWNIGFSLQWFIPIVLYMMLVSFKAILSAIFSIDLRFSFLMLCNGIYLALSVMIIIVYYLIPDGPWTLGFIFSPVIVIAFMFYTLLREKKFDLSKRINVSFLNNFFKTGSLFFMATIIANLLIYGDRWLLAEYDMPKSDIAVYSVAVQASMLVMVFLEQTAIFIAPIVSNIKNYNDITPSQVRKILRVTFLSILFVIIFGSIAGLLYIRIFYEEAFWLQGKMLFLIILGGLVFYPFQMFSRAFVIRFHSMWSVIFIYAAACVIMLMVVYFLKESLGIYGFAFGRQIAYIWISLSFFLFMKRHLLSRLKAV